MQWNWRLITKLKNKKIPLFRENPHSCQLLDQKRKSKQRKLGLVAVLGLFSSCEKWGLLFLAVFGLLIAVASPVAEHGLEAVQASSSWGMRAQQLQFPGSRAQAQELWRTVLVPPWHVGSSWTRDRTHVSCTGRWILHHWATREGLLHFLELWFLLYGNIFLNLFVYFLIVMVLFFTC